MPDVQDSEWAWNYIIDVMKEHVEQLPPEKAEAVRDRIKVINRIKRNYFIQQLLETQ